MLGGANYPQSHRMRSDSRVRAQVQDGKANAEVIRFLAQLIDCPQSRIAIKRGEKARIKIIEIAGINPEAVWGKLTSNRLSEKQ